MAFSRGDVVAQVLRGRERDDRQRLAAGVEVDRALVRRSPRARRARCWRRSSGPRGDARRVRARDARPPLPANAAQLVRRVAARHPHERRPRARARSGDGPRPPCRARASAPIARPSASSSGQTAHTKRAVWNGQTSTMREIAGEEEQRHGHAPPCRDARRRATSSASATSVTACAAPPRIGENSTASIALVSRRRLRDGRGDHRRRRSSRSPRTHHAAYESYMPSSGAGSVPPCRATHSCHGQQHDDSAPPMTQRRVAPAAPHAEREQRPRARSTMPCVRTSAHAPMAAPSATHAPRRRRLVARAARARAAARAASARKHSSESTMLPSMSSGTLTAVDGADADRPRRDRADARARAAARRTPRRRRGRRRSPP